MAPVDVIAILTILVTAGLLLMGIDGVMKGAFGTVTAYYFIKRVPQLAARKSTARKRDASK